MNKIFNNFHTLYLAYYYKTKACPIVAELDSLRANYGKHRLSSYFTLVVTEFNSLSVRSRDSMYNKWQATFGEDLGVAYYQMKKMSKQLKKCKVSSSNVTTCDSVAMCKFATSDSSVINKEQNDLNTLQSEVAELFKQIENHPYYEKVQEQVQQSLDNFRESLMFVTDNAPTLIAPVEPVLEEREESFDPFLIYPPEPEIEPRIPVESLLEGIDKIARVGWFNRIHYSNLEPIILQGTVELNSIYLRSNILQCLVGRMISNGKTMRRLIREDRLNDEVDFPDTEAPKRRKKQKQPRKKKVFKLKAQAEPKQEKKEEDDDDINPQPLPIETRTEFEIELDRLFDLLPSVGDPIEKQLEYATNMNLSPQEEKIIEIEIPEIEPLPLQTILAPPIVFATPEARTEVRRSRIPKSPLPVVPTKGKGRNEASKLSNRLHWPCNLDDRKGMVIHMLLNYTPLSHGKVCYDYLIWDIYSYVFPENEIVLGNIEQYMDENQLSDSDFEEEGLNLVGGMKQFVPNVYGKKQKKYRRVEQKQAEIPLSEATINAPAVYTSSDLYSPLSIPLAQMRPLTDQELRNVAERRIASEALSRTRRRIAEEKRRQRRRQLGLVDRFTRLPPLPEDIYYPVSPRAPSPEIEPRLPIRRIPPNRPLPVLPDVASRITAARRARAARIRELEEQKAEREESEESFNPFLTYPPEEEVESVTRILPPEPMQPDIEIEDPSGYFTGFQPDIYDNPSEAEFEDENRPGWVVQFKKPLKPITFEEDPETGRYRAPAKKLRGRRPKFGPEPRPRRGRQVQPRGQVIRKGWKINELGNLVETIIYEPTITRREFERTQNVLEREVYRMARKKRERTSVKIFNRAIELNEPNLSDQLTTVYRRVNKIRPGLKLSYFGFKFNKMKRVGRIVTGDDDFQHLVLYGPLQMFQMQTRNLENFIRRSIEREVNMWRIVIIYTNQTGQHITSTTWAGAYLRAYNMALNKITELIARYGEENVSIDGFEIRVRAVKGQQLIGGKKAIEDKLQGLEQLYTVINPRSRTNCLWTSIAIASGYQQNPDLIFNPKTQNQAGKNLKRKVGTRNEKGGTEEDLQKVSNYKQLNIEVLNLQGEVIGNFIPNREPQGSIKLMLNMGHYHSLLDNQDVVVQENKGLIREENPRQLQVIKVLNKNFTGRRIVAYDLESYRNPIGNNQDSMVEIDQVGYAIGWAIETKNIKEELEFEQKGYEIIEAEVKYSREETTKMVMAYKRILGEDCLNEAIDEWLHNPVYDQAVFYAHNGGKFDVRLILGQSNLLYRDKYVIVPEKLIELNGRLINMDIKNIFMEYENEEGKKRYHQISIRDSLPLFGPDSKLAKLTSELEVPHKKMEEKINVHELQNKDTWKENWFKYEMDQYLKCDVLGLLEVLTKFDKEVTSEIEIPITCVNTGASLAKKYYLKHHYKNVNETGQIDPSLSIYTLDREMDLFIRQGYGGGRCENFYCGELNQPVYYYDFTSLYPDVGRLPMPIGQPKWMVTPETLDENTEMIKGLWKERIVNRNIFGNTAYWKVKVRSPLAAAGNMVDPNIRKPLFGLQEEGMYVFRWFATWTEMVIYEEEIKFAIDQGLDYEFEPINGIIFQQGAVLESCMEDLFKKKAKAKEDGKPGLSKTWKIIINSLYGVWGLKVLDREGIEIARPEQSNWAIDLVTEKLMDVEKIGKYVISRRLKDLEVKDCNVALAAAVTSEARMKLYRLMLDIQNQNHQILYCDTDSIITTLCLESNQELKDKWIGPSNGKDLGSLKNEIEECYEKLNKKENKYKYKPYFDRAIIVAPKLYIVTAENGKIVKKAHKGYRENPEKGDIVTYERMKTLVDIQLPEEERTLEQDTEQWLGGNADILKDNIGVRIVKRHRVIQGICASGHPINKGILKEDGTIQPFIVRTDRRKRIKNKD